MPGTPNPLSEMTELKGKVISKDERPNPSFLKSALPGFKKTVQGRRAIRIFDEQPIPVDVMRDCLRDAVLAPSSSNLQTYELYWTQDRQKKKELAQYCLDQPAATTAGDMIVVVSRVDLWKSHLDKLVAMMTADGTRPLEGSLKEYYEKTVPMLLRTDRLGIHNLLRRFILGYKRQSGPMVNGPVRRSDHRVYGHVQATLAAENLMLSLAAHGYESCPMGGIDKKSIGRLLGLPTSAEVTMVIAAGTGKPEGLFSPRTRLPFDDLVKEF